MTTYNSFEAAKIANPESDIYKLIGLDGFVFGNGLGDLIRITSLQTDAEKCNPADHCMTVEKFLSDGYELRENDLILNSVGSVICMDYPNSLDDFGVLNSCSEKEYILRAAALEEKPSEKVEWVNGDECLYMNSSEVHKFIGVDPTRNDFCYIKANCSAVNWVKVAKLSKPETKQQREDRERLEAAYDLYCEWHEVMQFKVPLEFDTFCNAANVKLQWAAIVDKTNYRISK